MSDPDPDHVQVLAKQLHLENCLPGPVPYAQYSQDHRDGHTRRARRVLVGLGNAGYSLTTSEVS